jgi:hypothetical protein
LPCDPIRNGGLPAIRNHRTINATQLLIDALKLLEGDPHMLVSGGHHQPLLGLPGLFGHMGGEPYLFCQHGSLAGEFEQSG